MKVFRFTLSLLIACSLIVGSALQLQAQLVVNGASGAQELADILVGAGVEVTNVQLQCADNGFGSFNGEFTNLDLDGGILLTSGTIDNAVGPNNQGGASGGMGTPGDPDLDDISLGNTNDACVLVFDLVPLGDTLRFNYVFGSEEYLEFVDSFNDAFGFFITGPNPAGGDYDAFNIAIVPGTNTPVTINNVNTGDNPEYYVDNGTGANPGPNSTVQYDGFTTVLPAVVAVTPCETYTLKLAVADALDTALDSGVFIEEGSLSVDIVEISASTTVTSIEGFDHTVEGCVDGIITFDRNSTINQELEVVFTLSGDAENGVDYNLSSESIIIPAGESTAELFIEVLEDGFPEGTESIVITVESDLGCDEPIIQEATLNIEDADPLVVSEDQTISPGQSVMLQASGGGFNYFWSPAEGLDNPASATPMASPLETTTYTCTTLLGGCLYAEEVTVNVLIVECEADAGTVTAGPFDLCTGETNVTDALTAEGHNDTYDYIYIITDADLNVVGTSVDGSFDFTDAAVGSYCIHGLSYLAGAIDAPNLDITTVQELLDQTEACFDLITDGCIEVAVENCCGPDAGDTNAGPFDVCLGSSDATAAIEATDANPEYDYIYVITDTDLNIVGTSADGSFDFSAQAEGEYCIHGLSYEDGADDAPNLAISTVQELLDQTEACYDLILDGCVQVNIALCCTSDAGTVSNDDFVCAGGSSNATVENQVVDADDALVFALHNSPDSDLNMADFVLYDLNTDGHFMNAGIYPVNEELYISTVVGNAGADGFPDLNDPCLSISAASAVVFLTAIEFSFDEDCNEDNYDFTLTITVTGGLPEYVLGETYSANGIVNNLDLFNNEPFVLALGQFDNQVYTLDVEDGAGCTQSYVSDQISCSKKGVDCESYSGIIGLDNDNICEGGNTAVVQFNQPNLDSNDAQIYALHNSSNGDVEAADFEIYASNTTGMFINDGTLPTGVIMYVSSIVGTDDGTGLPNLGDNCLSVSPPVAVTFISGIIADPEVLCDGGTYQLSIIINGGAGGSYTVNGTETAIENEEIVVGPYENQTEYSIEVIDEAGCAYFITGGPIECSSVAIELVYFTGEVLEAGNMLNWETATETNNDYFTLERSSDGVNFESISIIDGAGNSNTNLVYSYLDATATGVNYYRLMQTDFDGTNTKSDVVTLIRPEEILIISSISPVPASEILYVTLHSNIAQAATTQVYDAAGRLVINQTNILEEGENINELDLAQLSSGVYMISVSTDEGIVLTDKFIKD